jgi:hypothetical protein
MTGTLVVCQLSSLTGDFLQFGPIQQKGLLSDMEQIAEEYVKKRPNDRKVQKHWRQLMAKRLWEKFNNVIILEEQKRAAKDPFLQGLLERIRNGQQTQEDMDKLNATCYDPQATMNFSQGRSEALHRETHTGGTSPYTPRSNTARSTVKKGPSSSPHINGRPESRARKRWRPSYSLATLDRFPS